MNGFEGGNPNPRKGSDESPRFELEREDASVVIDGADVTPFIKIMTKKI